MRAILGLITVLGIIYWGVPRLTDKIYLEIKKASLKQVSQKMTPLSLISNRLTEKSGTKSKKIK